MPPGTILVAGATGRLGGVIVRRLLGAGVPVRALGRNRDKLESLAALGADTVACDMLDRATLDRRARTCHRLCPRRTVSGPAAAVPSAWMNRRT